MKISMITKLQLLLMPVKNMFLWKEVLLALLKVSTMLKVLALPMVLGNLETTTTIVVALVIGTALIVVFPTLLLVMNVSSAPLLDLKVPVVMLVEDKTTLVLVIGIVPIVLNLTLLLVMSASSVVPPDLKVLVATLVRDVVLVLEEMVIGIVLGKSFRYCGWFCKTFIFINSVYF